MAVDANTFDLEFNEIYMVNKGTGDHSKLENRNLPNQHTIESIEGLVDILANTPSVAGACDKGCIPVFDEKEDGTVAIASSGLALQRITSVVDGVKYAQEDPQSIWKIKHDLNKIPTVVVTDDEGNTVMCDIKHVNLNEVELRFSRSFSGKAYIS